MTRQNSLSAEKSKRRKIEKGGKDKEPLKCPQEEKNKDNKRI